MSWTTDPDAGARPDPAVIAAEGGRLVAGADRRIAVPPSVARQHLLRVIRDLSFELRTEQLSLLEAVRGSKLGGVTLSAARVPVALRIGLEADGDGCRVAVLLADRWAGKVGRNWGLTSAYVQLFESVLGAVDGVLGRLDPSGAAAFTGWWRQTGPGDVAIMQNAASLANRAGAVLSRHASRLLDGDSPAQRRASVSRAGTDTFTFEAPQAVAEVPAELADGMLMVGTLIASRPGDMPPNLVAQVQSLVFRVEEHLASVAPGAAPAGRFAVEPADVPVVTFLHQQARLRGMLPARNLRTCTTCRLEKVTNPDLERLQERSRRTRDLATSISAVITPYVLAGRLAQLNNKGPTFACPRCQGMDADETVVTFCQRCGDRRAETALRTCAKCQFDFRSLIAGDQLWQSRPAPSSPQPPAPEPTPAPAPEPPRASAPEPSTAPPSTALPTTAPAPEPPTTPRPVDPEADQWPRPPGYPSA
ncbi:hypothetical protein [Micromonospora sagamiensis]|uniref:Uncharacterized protein n=1 Tax=Micromonospora sagamiensis TaxID=47875 RepID=A0A562WAF4_9ACTN|nr:hypothetical protein [Micromonospora sagamiensis]TWJ26971.1 hypothetical protein JD81_00453 [Micromonospora sagamiensis]BCL14139.1 hypothetical protein GCM10017556_18780 [Micromonospora sagamiensis]